MPPTMGDQSHTSEDDSGIQGVRAATSTDEQVRCAVRYLKVMAVRDREVIDKPKGSPGVERLLKVREELSKIAVDGEMVCIFVSAISRTRQDFQQGQEAVARSRSNQQSCNSYSLFWSVVLVSLLSSPLTIASKTVIDGGNDSNHDSSNGTVSGSESTITAGELCSITVAYLTSSLEAARLVSHYRDDDGAAEQVWCTLFGISRQVKKAVFLSDVSEKALTTAVVDRLHLYAYMISSSDVLQSPKSVLSPEIAEGLLTVLSDMQECTYQAGGVKRGTRRGGDGDDDRDHLSGLGALWMRSTFFFLSFLLDAIVVGCRPEEPGQEWVLQVTHLNMALKLLEGWSAHLTPQEPEREELPLSAVEAAACREFRHCSSTPTLGKGASYEILEEAVRQRLEEVGESLCDFRSPAEFMVMLLKEAMPMPASPHSPCSSRCSGPFTCSQCVVLRCLPSLGPVERCRLSDISYNRLDTLLRGMLQRMIPRVAKKFTCAIQHKEELVRIAVKSAGDSRVLKREGMGYLSGLTLCKATTNHLVRFLEELVKVVHIEVSHYVERDGDGGSLCVTVEGSFVSFSEARERWHAVVTEANVPPCFVRLKVNAAVVLTLDENFYYPGVSVELASRWVQTAKTAPDSGGEATTVVIDVSGANGRNGTDGVDGAKAGNAGTDGTSGEPGQAGGNIKITCGAEIRSRLLLRSNGGKGGDGGRGGNGKNGTDGKDGRSAEARYPSSSRDSLCDSSYCYNYNYLIAIEAEPALLAPGKGGASGRRGINGFAGAAGDIEVSPMSQNITIVNVTGGSGEPGRLGCAGLAGKHGNQSTAAVYKGGYHGLIWREWRERTEDFYPNGTFNAVTATDGGSKIRSDVARNYFFDYRSCDYTPMNFRWVPGDRILREGRLTDRSILNGLEMKEPAGTVSKFSHEGVSGEVIASRIAKYPTTTSRVQRVDLSSISTANHESFETLKTMVEGESLDTLMRENIESITRAVSEAASLKEALERHQERIQTLAGITIDAPDIDVGDDGSEDASAPSSAQRVKAKGRLPFLPLSALAAHLVPRIQQYNIDIAKHYDGTAGSLLEAAADLEVLLQKLSPHSDSGSMALLRWCQVMSVLIKKKLDSLGFSELRNEVEHGPSYVPQWALDGVGRRLSFYSCYEALQQTPTISYQQRAAAREKAEYVLTCRNTDVMNLCREVGAAPVCPLLFTVGGQAWGKRLFPSVVKFAFEALKQPLVTWGSGVYAAYCEACSEFSSAWSAERRKDNAMYVAEEHMIRVYEWLVACAPTQDIPAALSEAPSKVCGWLMDRTIPKHSAHYIIKVMYYWVKVLFETKSVSQWSAQLQWKVLLRTVCQLEEEASLEMMLTEYYIGELMQAAASRENDAAAPRHPCGFWSQCATSIKAQMPTRDCVSAHNYAMALWVYFALRAVHEQVANVEKSIHTAFAIPADWRMKVASQTTCRCKVADPKTKEQIKESEGASSAAFLFIPETPCETCSAEQRQSTTASTISVEYVSSSGSRNILPEARTRLISNAISLSRVLRSCLPYLLESMETNFGSVAHTIVAKRSLIKRLATAHDQPNALLNMFLFDFELVEKVCEVDQIYTSDPEKFSPFAAPVVAAAGAARSSPENPTAAPSPPSSHCLLYDEFLPKRRHAAEAVVLSHLKWERPGVSHFLTIAGTTFKSAADFDLFARGLPKANADCVIRACINRQLQHICRESFYLEDSDAGTKMQAEVDSCCQYARWDQLLLLCDLLSREYEEMKADADDGGTDDGHSQGRGRRRLVVYPEIVRVLLQLLPGFTPGPRCGGVAGAAGQGSIQSVTQWLSRVVEDKYWGLVESWWSQRCAADSAPWHQLWYLGLRLEECRAREFFSWMRSLTETDVMNRLSEVLDVPEPVKSPLALFSEVVRKEPSSWSSMVRGWYDAFHSLQRQSAEEIQERRWGEIAQWIRDEQQQAAFSNADVLLAQRVWEACNRLFLQMRRDPRVLPAKLRQFMKEWKGNTHLRGSQRMADTDVREKEKELLQNESELVEVLTTIFAAFFQARNGMVPRCVQVLAVIELIQGSRLANINTSEGKTYTCGVVLAFKAYCGYSVAFMTSNDALAAEAKAYHDGAFQLLFGSQFAAVDRPSTSTSSVKKDTAYQCHSVYTTLHHLQSHLLTASMNASHATHFQQWASYPRWFVLDECDVAMIDFFHNVMMIGPRMPKMVFRAVVYPTLLLALRNSISADDTYEMYCNRLRPQHVNCNDMFIFSRPYFDALYKGAKKALALRQNYQYVNVKERAIPYNVATGETMHGTEWQDGVSTMVNMLQGQQWEWESETFFSLTNFSTIQDHMKGRLTGVTGTVGGYLTQLVYQHEYGMGVLVMPTAFQCRQEVEKPQYFTRPGTYLVSLTEEVTQKVRRKQSVLVATEHVFEAQQLVNLLSAKLSNINVASYYLETDAHPVLSDLPQVIVTTARGGRGMDLVLPPSQRKHGLHVILTSALHERASYQVVRRGARGRDRGSCRIMLNGEIYERGTDTELVYAAQNRRIVAERRRLEKMIDLDAPLLLFNQSLRRGVAAAVAEQSRGALRADVTALQYLLFHRLGEWKTLNAADISSSCHRRMGHARLYAKFASTVLASVAKGDGDGAINMTKLSALCKTGEERLLTALCTIERQCDAHILFPRKSWKVCPFGTAALHGALRYVTVGEDNEMSLSNMNGLRDALGIHMKRLTALCQMYSGFEADLMKVEGLQRSKESAGLSTVQVPSTQYACSIRNGFNGLRNHMASLIGTNGVLKLQYSPPSNSIEARMRDFFKVVKSMEGRLIHNPSTTFSRLEEGLKKLFPEDPEKCTDILSMVPSSGTLSGLMLMNVLCKYITKATSKVQEGTKQQPSQTSVLAMVDELYEGLVIKGTITHVCIRMDTNKGHMHNEEYHDFVRDCIGDTHNSDSVMAYTQMLVSCAGKLRAKQVRSIYWMPTSQAVKGITVAMEKELCYIGLGFTFSLMEHLHCAEVRKKLEEAAKKEREQNKQHWLSRLWNGVKQVATKMLEFAAKTLVSSCIAAICPFASVITAAVVSGFNSVVKYVKTGVFSLKETLKSMGMAAIGVVASTYVASYAKQAMAYVKDTQIGQCITQLADRVNSCVSGIKKTVGSLPIIKDIGGVAERVRTFVGGAAEGISSSTGISSGFTTAVMMHGVETAKSMAFSTLASYATESLCNNVTKNWKDDVAKTLREELREPLGRLLREAKGSLSARDYKAFREGVIKLFSVEGKGNEICATFKEHLHRELSRAGDGVREGLDNYMDGKGGESSSGLSTMLAATDFACTHWDAIKVLGSQSREQHVKQGCIALVEAVRERYLTFTPIKSGTGCKGNTTKDTEEGDDELVNAAVSFVTETMIQSVHCLLADIGARILDGVAAAGAEAYRREEEARNTEAELLTSADVSAELKALLCDPAMEASLLGVTHVERDMEDVMKMVDRVILEGGGAYYNSAVNLLVDGLRCRDETLVGMSRILPQDDANPSGLLDAVKWLDINMEAITAASQMSSEELKELLGVITDSSALSAELASTENACLVKIEGIVESDSTDGTADGGVTEDDADADDHADAKYYIDEDWKTAFAKRVFGGALNSDVSSSLFPPGSGTPRLLVSSTEDKDTGAISQSIIWKGAQFGMNWLNEIATVVDIVNFFADNYRITFDLVAKVERIGMVEMTAHTMENGKRMDQILLVPGNVPVKENAIQNGLGKAECGGLVEMKVLVMKDGKRNDQILMVPAYTNRDALTGGKRWIPVSWFPKISRACSVAQKVLFWGGVAVGVYDVYREDIDKFARGAAVCGIFGLGMYAAPHVHSLLYSSLQKKCMIPYLLSLEIVDPAAKVAFALATATLYAAGQYLYPYLEDKVYRFVRWIREKAVPAVLKEARQFSKITCTSRSWHY